MSHKIDTNKPVSETRWMFGRRTIYSEVQKVTRENVVDVLQKAMQIHEMNRSEIDYLWCYYKGNQPILNRIKNIRPEICNRVVENRANEIVSFKVGYQCGEPIQYISQSSDENTVDEINQLNSMMFAEGKISNDRELFEWLFICGTSYRIVLPDKEDVDEEDGSPFDIFVLDPRNTFVVYSTEIGNEPLIGVKYYETEQGLRRFSVYTKNEYFLIEEDRVLTQDIHALGSVPIIEYPANTAKLGSFEIVLSLLDSINLLQSNRMDGTEQFVQAFWKFVGCNIEMTTFKEFLEEGAIVVPPSSNQTGKIDVDLVVKELNQIQTQTQKEDLYNSILTICGMPNRNGGSSTSDTGTAVHLRDGWSQAETRAKDVENIFKESEKRMLKIVLRICRDLAGFKLKLKDIDIKFTRRNYEAIQSKSQVLISMLQQPKIHPLLAFLQSGMFADAEWAYSISKEYFEEFERKQQEFILAQSKQSQEKSSEDKSDEGTSLKNAQME